MATRPDSTFGKRKPVAIQAGPPVKRSNHVVLLLMGTFAIGGSAYALMPSERCEPGIASPSGAQASAECRSRGSSSSGGHGSSGGSSSRSSFYGGDSSSSRSSGASADSSSGVTRGGFGSFAHSFTSHFSGGG